MFCEAGPVKTRLAARVVPDLDPGPLAREHRPQPSAVSLHLHDFLSTTCFGEPPRIGVYNIAGVENLAIVQQHSAGDFLQKLRGHHGSHVIDIALRIVFDDIGTDDAVGQTLDNTQHIPDG